MSIHLVQRFVGQFAGRAHRLDLRCRGWSYRTFGNSRRLLIIMLRIKAGIRE